MKRLILGFALLTSACMIDVRVRPPQPSAPVEPTFRAVSVVVRDETGKPLQDARCTIEDVSVETDHHTVVLSTTPSNADGYIVWLYISTGLRDTQLACYKEGYADFSEHRILMTDKNEDLLPATMHSLHFDPTTVPLEVLARIRGSMWTARLNVPYGPRPGQDSNILAMDFYSVYSKEDRARMIQAYKARGYTHAVTGPVTGNDCYHNLYPCFRGVPSQEVWDAYLDDMQEWWDAGIIPVFFAKPDGMNSPEEMAQLDELFMQPRAQRLLRVVVYTGWEPWKYELTNAEWVRWVQHAQDVFPTALRLIHTVGDVDAPTGGNDDKVLKGGNAEAWANVALYIHGWLVQSGGYVFGPSCTPTDQFLAGFSDLYNANKRGSLIDRFHNGYAGWPKFSAWGLDKPLKVYAGEYAAYADFWKNCPESVSQDLGDLAFTLGADGYLDGGRISFISGR